MKWLYKILRLVKCPHKYYQINKVALVEYPGAMSHADRYTCRCSRCGKIKGFRV